MAEIWYVRRRDVAELAKTAMAEEVERLAKTVTPEQIVALRFVARRLRPQDPEKAAFLYSLARELRLHLRGTSGSMKEEVANG